MEDHIQDFMHFLIVEKGLAKNTIESYQRDLKNYALYLSKVEEVAELNTVSRVNILQFLGHLKNQGNLQRPLPVMWHRSGLFINSY